MDSGSPFPFLPPPRIPEDQLVDLRPGRLKCEEKIAWLAMGLLGLSVALAAWQVLVQQSLAGLQVALQIGLPFFLLAILLGLVVRARTQESLKAQRLTQRLVYCEEILALTAGRAPWSLIIFDPRNRYWFVNGSALSLVGCKTSGSLVGFQPKDVMPPDQAQRMEALLEEARHKDTPVEHVSRRVDSLGKTHLVQTRYERVPSLGGLAGYVLVSEEDLTLLLVERERRERMLHQLIETLVAVVDRRDPYAAGHSSRVGQLSVAMARGMGLDESQTEAVEIAGSLMNFGKVLVPRHLLTKESALTPEELDRVRQGMLASADIVSIIGFDSPVIPTLREVLEHVDGSGQPAGLKGNEILLPARIVTLANAFVALVSERAHRRALPVAAALQNVENDAGKLYDPEVVQILRRVVTNPPPDLDWLRSLPPTSANPSDSCPDSGKDSLNEKRP